MCLSAENRAGAPEVGVEPVGAEPVFVLCGGELVDLVRFELTTSSMPWKRAPNCATGPFCADSLRIAHPKAMNRQR